MIDVVASEPHYWEMLRPVVAALAPSERGTLYAPNLDVQTDLCDVQDRPPDKRSQTPLLACSWGDAQRGKHRPVVLLEHGQGSSYGDGALSVGYVGGLGRDHISLFLDPNDHARQLHAERYPNTPGAVVGQPYLDTFAVGPRDTGVVVFAGHWDSTVNDAQRSAYPHYWDGMRAVVDELRADDWEVRGSGHPRGRTKPPNFGHHWERLGVEPMWDFAQVLREAEVLVADNTSAQCLSAALGVRQVLLDCPWYARARERRWWPRWAVDLGVEVSEAAQIPDAVRRSYVPDVSSVVPWVGGDGARAAEAIRRWVL